MMFHTREFPAYIPRTAPLLLICPPNRAVPRAKMLLLSYLLFYIFSLAYLSRSARFFANAPPPLNREGLNYGDEERRALALHESRLPMLYLCGNLRRSRREKPSLR